MITRARLLFALICCAATATGLFLPLHAARDVALAQAAGAESLQVGELNRGHARKVCRILTRLSPTVSHLDSSAATADLKRSIDSAFSGGSVPVQQVIGAMDDMASKDCPVARETVLTALHASSLRDGLGSQPPNDHAREFAASK